MLDPVSIIGIATTAFNGLKAAVQAGRQLEDCLGQLGDWAGAISDLDKADSLIQKKKSSLFRSLLPTNGKSVQQQAVEVWHAKQVAKKQREDLREMVRTTLGQPAWEEFLTIEAQIRSDRQQAFYAEIERREKAKDAALTTLVVVLSISSVVGILWLALAIAQHRG